jgi:hypothetical protein
MKDCEAFFAPSYYLICELPKKSKSIKLLILIKFEN